MREGEAETTKTSFPSVGFSRNFWSRPKQKLKVVKSFGGFGPYFLSFGLRPKPCPKLTPETKLKPLKLLGTFGDQKLDPAETGSAKTK